MLNGFYLTLQIGPALPIPAPRPVMEALLSAQVTVSAGQRTGFQLTFGVSKNSPLLNALLPAGYFDPSMRVIVTVMVTGIPQVLIDGVITRQELTPSNEPGQSRLVVTGEDLTRMMDLIELNGVPFPAMPRETRVAMLLAKYAVFGIVPLIIPSLIPDVEDPEDIIRGQQGTDFEYIKQLADEVGYVFYLDPGPVPGTSVAYWGPEIKVGLPQSALTTNMDAASNVESIDFSYEGFTKTQFVLNVQVPATPPVTIPIPLPDIGPLNPPLGAKPLPFFRVQTLETADDTALEAACKGLAKASQSADVVSASGQLDVLRYGKVLNARSLVGVRGAGFTYDGLYFVKSVTHNIKHGEYKQSFSLTRNALVSFTPVVLP
jgi:hypothetical protein